jgi:flagellin
LINGVLVDQSLAQDDTKSFSNNSASAISKAAAINKVSDLTGVVATVNETKVYGTAMDQTVASSGSITINGVTTSTMSFAVSASTSVVRGTVIDAINAMSAQSGVVASDGGDDNHGVVLTAVDGRNITVSYTSATGAFNGDLTGVRADGTYVGTYSLTSVDGSDIELSAQVGKNIANSDLKAGTYQANTAQFVSGYRTPNAISAGVAPAPTALLATTLSINGIAVGAALNTDDTATFETTTSATKVSSAIATAAAINRVKDLTGVTAKANANVLVGTGFATGVQTSTVASTSIYLNGVTISANVTADTTRADLVNLINLQTGRTGVLASDNGDGLTLVAEDGRTISLGVANGSNPTSAAVIGLNTINGVSTVLANTSASSAGSMAFVASVTLQSDKTFNVTSGSSGNSDFGTLGFVQGTYGGSSDMLNVEHLDVSTQSGAMVAISAIDSAINQVSMQQSRAGAYQNRLDAVVNNLTESNQNMSASRSRILDTDYAQETTSLAKSQIISQAATAMLAQANQAGQSVLALLK